MTRRELMKMAALAPLAALAPWWIPENFSAMEYLTKAYNGFYRDNRRLPKRILVSRALFDKIEDEFMVNQRFCFGGEFNDAELADIRTNPRNLAFKTCTLEVYDMFKGLDYAIGG